MAKKRNEDGGSKPLSLATMGQYGFLEGFSPPPGGFDPNGSWKHMYGIWLTGGAGRRGSLGFLALERAPAADAKGGSASGGDGKAVSLTVEVCLLQSVLTTHRTRAAIQCEADTLLTPRSWKLESVILDTEGKPVALTQVEETGEVKDGRIEIRPSKAEIRPRTLKLAGAFTTNWSLFDAVQRLPGKDTHLLDFTLLEDLDLLKEGQRLSFRGATSLPIGGKTIAVNEYQQIGEGILPFHYGVDDQRRLLFVVTSQRAYVWNPNAPQQMEEMRERLSRRAKK
jgi:hypothetical protein